MGYYKLIREAPEGKAIKGTLYRGTKELSVIASTLENVDYVIPALIYKLQVNYSPKFGTLMPIILQVPGREGIRIHFGTKPIHSRGCILITHRADYVRFVEELLEEQKSKAPIYIEVRNHND